MALDENALRAAGLPASLISLLVSITRAAERAQAAANSAAAANDLAPQLQAAVQALDELNIAPDLDARLRAVVSRVAEIDVALSEVPQASEFEASATAAATAALQQALAELPLPLVDIDVEGDSLIMILSDGSRVVGAQLPAGGPVGTQIAPELSGGSLEFDGQDLVTVAPELLRGTPAPQVTLALTRDGVDVTDELVDSRIPDAPLGNYLAVWIAANGILPNSTRTVSLVVAAPALVAPSVTATASISRSQTSSVLDGPDDVVAGNPEPSPTYQWFDGNTPISGANSKSYDPGSALGEFARQTTWSNGVGLPAVSRSNTITIAAVPAIEAEITPNPLVAGQQASITFNVAPDSVTGSVALTGSGLTRSFIAPSDDTVNVTIGASKSGYTAFSGVFNVLPAAPEVFTDTTYNVRGVRNLSGTPYTLPITDPAKYGPDISLTADDGLAGPEPETTPVLTSLSGNPLAVGETAVFDFGAVVAQTPQPLYTEIRWYLDAVLVRTGGATYLIPAEAAQRYLTVVWVLGDEDGRFTDGQTPDLIIPAIPSTDTDTFTAPDGTLINAYVGETGIAWEDKTQVVIRDGTARANGSSTWTTVKRLDMPDPLQPLEVLYDNKGTSTSGVYPAMRISADGLSYLRMIPFGTSLRFMRVVWNAATSTATNTTFIDIPVAELPATPRFRFEPDPNGTTIRLYINGTLRATVEDAVLTTGSIGLVSYGHSTVDGVKGANSNLNGILEFKGE